MKTFKQFLLENPIYDPAYHGSTNPNLSFQEPKIGSKKKSNKQLDFGTHFTQDKNYAENYASNKNGRVYFGTVNLQNPLDLTKKLWYKNDPDFQPVLHLSKHLKLNNSLFNIDKNGNKSNETEFVVVTSNHLNQISPQKVHDALLKHGFDGVIYQPFSHSSTPGYYVDHPKSYIALHKHQLNFK